MDRLVARSVSLGKRRRSTHPRGEKHSADFISNVVTLLGVGHFTRLGKTADRPAAPSNLVSGAGEQATDQVTERENTQAVYRGEPQIFSWSRFVLAARSNQVAEDTFQCGQQCSLDILVSASVCE